MASGGTALSNDWLEAAKEFVAISIWVGALFATLFSLVISLCLLPHWAAVLWLVLMVRSRHLQTCIQASCSPVSDNVLLFYLTILLAVILLLCCAGNLTVHTRCTACLGASVHTVFFSQVHRLLPSDSPCRGGAAPWPVPTSSVRLTAVSCKVFTAGTCAWA